MLDDALAAVRGEMEDGRIDHRGWCDTTEMLANGLTKLDETEGVPVGDFSKITISGEFFRMPYVMDGVDQAPERGGTVLLMTASAGYRETLTKFMSAVEARAWHETRRPGFTEPNVPHS